jgi:UDP-glucose 4-epimerase
MIDTWKGTEGDLMAVLVCGGAGYIGSHTVAYLLERNEDVLVFDNLVKGHKKAIPEVRFFRGDVRNKEDLLEVFKKHDIEAVINFAAYIEAGESVRMPLKYYENNIGGAMCLLEAMREADVKKIVFSSTAAVYGNPVNIPIKESDPTVPVNPYGETKLAVEKMLKWSDRAYGIKYVALRYFNAAGAHFSGKIGEDHDPETHLIPIVLKNAMGKGSGLKLFGDDYDTDDGTCIRDYIHVSDLADAHHKALIYLRENEVSDIFNLGNGKGFSNRQIVDSAMQVTGIRIPYEITERRQGDPDILVASSEKAKTLLGWEPGYTDVGKIIETAWRWHSNNPEGFCEN